MYIKTKLRADQGDYLYAIEMAVLFVATRDWYLATTQWVSLSLSHVHYIKSDMHTAALIRRQMLSAGIL